MHMHVGPNEVFEPHYTSLKDCSRKMNILWDFAHCKLAMSAMGGLIAKR